jgi:hypothetical protein
VTPGDRLALLQALYRDKLALYRRHQAGAALVSAYDANNTYQYILAREDAHLQWLRGALEEMGSVPDETVAPLDPLPSGKGPAAASAVAEDDARRAGEFVARWQPRVAAFSHARDRKLLDLILGEVAEHQRFFAQAASGRADLLGRRPDGVGTGGGVLPVRWIE